MSRYTDSPAGEIRVVEGSTSGLSDGSVVGVALDSHEEYVFDTGTGSTIARTGGGSPGTDGVSGRAATDD